MNELAKLVNVFNDGEELTARWDGKDYTLGSEPVIIARGVAEHWKGVHAGAQLRVEEVTPEQIEAITPVNPLIDNDRGQAFAGLQKPEKPAKPPRGKPQGKSDK